MNDLCFVFPPWTKHKNLVFVLVLWTCATSENRKCFNHKGFRLQSVHGHILPNTNYTELGSENCLFRPDYIKHHIIISAIVHPHLPCVFLLVPECLYITPHSIGLSTARIIGVVFRLEYRLYSTLRTCIWIEWPAVMNVCVIPVHYHSQLFRVENSSSLTPVSIPTALPFGVFARSFKIENLSLLVNLRKCLRCFYQVSFFFFWRSSELE